MPHLEEVEDHQSEQVDSPDPIKTDKAEVHLRRLLKPRVLQNLLRQTNPILGLTTRIRNTQTNTNSTP